MKNQTFPPSQELQESVNEFAAATNLEVTTSEIQKKNGTIVLHDPEANVDYVMYSSGYVRRVYGSYFGLGMYPLNPRTNTKVERSWGDYILRDYILIDGAAQLEILKKRIPAFRKKAIAPKTRTRFSF